MESGRTQIYTGCGKGKTTVALGLALRASGHGLKVLIVQFMKGSTDYGELESLKKLEIKCFQYGRPDFVDPKNPQPVDFQEAKSAYEKVFQAASSGQWDVVIADEINIAHFFNLISTEQVIKLIKSRCPKTELVLTGRYAPVEAIELADLVTEMREIKHYFNTEQLIGRQGIEF